MKLILRLGIMGLILGSGALVLPRLFATPQESAPASTSTIDQTLSPQVAEVIKMADAKEGNETILEFIRNSKDPFSLTSNNIIYLNDLGISTDLIDAMLSRDKELVASSPANTQAEAPANPLPEVDSRTVDESSVQAEPARVEADTERYSESQPVVAPRVSTIPKSSATRYVEVQSPPTEVRYFYNQLSPYGTWVQLDDVGWAWQPNTVVVNSDWQPYSDGGHWVWTDGGWYWDSDYSWGWAAFHYGRWQHTRHHGWVWCPDTEWAPAWVTWRVHDDYCGWAPLPPHSYYDRSEGGFRYGHDRVSVNFDFGLDAASFTFTTFDHFNDRSWSRHRLPRQRVNNIFNQTTIVNNYYAADTTSGALVNRGVGVQRVAAATGKRIEPVKIQDQAVVGSNLNRSTTSRSRHAVVRASLPKPVAPTEIAVQKVSATQPIAPQVVKEITHQRPQTNSRLQDRNAVSRDTRVTESQHAASTPVQASDNTIVSKSRVSQGHFDRKNRAVETDVQNAPVATVVKPKQSKAQAEAEKLTSANEEPKQTRRDRNAPERKAVQERKPAVDVSDKKVNPIVEKTHVEPSVNVDEKPPERITRGDRDRHPSNTETEAPRTRNEVEQPAVKPSAQVETPRSRRSSVAQSVPDLTVRWQQRVPERQPNVVSVPRESSREAVTRSVEIRTQSHTDRAQDNPVTIARHEPVRRAPREVSPALVVTPAPQPPAVAPAAPKVEQPKPDDRSHGKGRDKDVARR